MSFLSTGCPCKHADRRPAACLCHFPTASYETLDSVLRHDRRRIPVLLDYVRYPHNPAIQVGCCQGKAGD